MGTKSVNWIAITNS